MKKLTLIEIAVIIFALATFTIFSLPYLFKNNSDEIMATVKASNAIFTSKVIEEFAQNKNIKPSIVAKKVAKELNESQQNPYRKGEEFYVFDKEAIGCTVVDFDDNLKMIILTTLDKKGTLIARTVINPPSFVTYYKEKDLQK